MISSADNKPIVGVSVYVEGTTVGATSDINGNYTLKVPAGTKHVTFAFLGYDTKKIAVADVELFKLVTLIEASNVMDDVVVVAFGTQKKESLVGAVQVVRPSTLKVTSSNLSTSFAGKIAGVISTQSSGEPGADGANFWIRGISTFGANKSPLLILDGVEDPHNLGSIIRSAVCAGAHGIIIPRRRAVSVTAAACKASAGAVEYAHIARVANIANAIARLKDEGLWIAGADMSGTAMTSARMEGALALVIGSEGDGIGRLVKEKCDFLVSIPMFGQIDSLNAAVAAAVLMFEKRRQDGIRKN